MHIRFAILIMLIFASSVQAQDRQKLGYGRLLTNDAFGDNLDRWRTGSVASSRVWGPEWTGTLPEGFGELIELRLGAEIIAPGALVIPDPRDRPYAGVLTAGIHTHFARGENDYALGVDLAFTGPATRLDELQSAFHDLLGVPEPSAAVKDAQIGNGIHPGLVFEAGRELALPGKARLRPFVEARTGVETLARAGFDLSIGAVGQKELLVRDPVSGHRYRVINETWRGFSYVFGADVAYVADSALLPEENDLLHEDIRTRARAGVHWQNGKGGGLFYGLTYLGREFDAQPEGQWIGSVRVNWRF